MTRLIKSLRLSVLTIVFLSCNNLSVTDLAQYVNTFTSTYGPANNWYEGHCFPGPSIPFGLVQFSPDNKDGNQSS